MQAANGAHLSFPPRPTVVRHFRRLGQPQHVAEVVPSPESEPDGSWTPSFVFIEVNLQYKCASTSQFASYVRFPPPPRAIESSTARARPNARATAYRFKSLKISTVRNIPQTVKKVYAHAGLKK